MATRNDPALSPRACPMCGGARSSRLFVSRNGFPILRCGDCSLVFTDDRGAPPPSELYPTFDQSTALGLEVARRGLGVFLRQREALLRSLKPAGRLLDFGCGNGAFAQWMSRSGYDVVGLEPFSLGKTVSRDHLTLMQAPLEQVEQELGTFDIITLWHVLEHLTQPVEVLARLGRHLNPDGVLVISVPNFQSWQRALFRGGWFHLDPPRHLLHFEPATLSDCLGRAGFSQVGQHPFLPEYGSSGWVQSVLNACLPPEGRSRGCRLRVPRFISRHR